ncbi:MAG: DNA-binding protein WhiA [Clostridiales bacterium]|nr:DNA-binding protein WhiA [Clostridiales bacterium]
MAISGLDVKRELTELRLKDDERDALLSGFVRSCMTLSMNKQDGMLLGLDCQVDFVREYIAAAMMKQFKVSSKSGDSALLYADCEKLLRMLGILELDGDEYTLTGIPERFYEHDSAYVRGMFLGCGSFSVRGAESAEGRKGGGGYHLEFSFVSESIADELANLLSKKGIAVRKMLRADKTVIYAKDSENVSNCLALMHADKTVLKLVDTVVTLSMKKDINRLQNCDLANMTRIANAAVDVAKAIEIIEEKVGLDTLDPKLVEAADARINSPDLSLSELAYELGISKSGLKHRYDKIIETANKLSTVDKKEQKEKQKK